MKKLLVTLALFLIVGVSIAQDLTISNVSPKMRKFRGVESVEGLGYYSFILDEKSKKGFKIFNLYIWDYELNEIAKASLELEKRSQIVDAVYNGNNFMVVFYDSKKNNVRSLSFDKTGKQVAETLVDGMKTKFMFMEDFQPSYYAAGDQGFYGVIPDKEPKFGFHITKFDNELNEQWKTSYFPTKGQQIVMDAKSDDDKLVILKFTKAKGMTKKADIDVTAFNSKDGSESWTYDLNLGDKTLLPTEMAISEDGNTAVAGMYFDGEKIKGINSDGIFFSNIGPEGKEIGHSTQGWAGELQKFLKASKGGINIGKAKVVFEDIIYEASTGKFKVVGEMFSVNTAGKVLAMMGGDNDAETKVTIEDLVVFTFDADGTLDDFYSVNKSRVNIFLPNSVVGGLKIARYLKESGSLPYLFIGLNSGGDATAFYLDFLKKDDEGNLTSSKMAAFNQNKMGVGMLNLNTSTGENPDVKYLPLSKKAANKDEKSDVEFDSKWSKIYVTESQAGKILISELSIKTGDLRMFFEDVE